MCINVMLAMILMFKEVHALSWFGMYSWQTFAAYCNNWTSTMYLQWDKQEFPFEQVAKRQYLGTTIG